VKYVIVTVVIGALALPTTPAVAATCGTGEPSAFRFPLDEWDPNCNDFWSTCNGAPHLGMDSAPDSGVVGTPVKAACSGVVRDASFHNGYGGVVIIECTTGDECVTALTGHLFPDDVVLGGVQYYGLQVNAGDIVEIGQTVGQLGDRHWYRNGGWAPHVHFGIRKGAYQGGTACDGNWTYAGYAANTCVKKDWHDPALFVPAHNTLPSYSYNGNATSCMGPVSGGSGTGWVYTCERSQNAFRRDQTVQTLIRIDDVQSDHQFSVSAYRNGQFQWEWSPGMNHVGNGWDHSSFWPTLEGGEPGSWRFDYYVDLADDSTGVIYLDTVHFVVLPYAYDGNAVACGGPVTGGWWTDWYYTCQKPRTSFYWGEEVKTLIRLDDVTADHQFTVRAHREGAFQWEWSPGVNHVDGWWQYSSFWPTLSWGSPGNWEMQYFVDVLDGAGPRYLDSASFLVF